MPRRSSAIEATLKSDPVAAGDGAVSLMERIGSLRDCQSRVIGADIVVFREPLRQLLHDAGFLDVALECAALHNADPFNAG